MQATKKRFGYRAVIGTAVIGYLAGVASVLALGAWAVAREEAARQAELSELSAFLVEEFGEEWEYVPPVGVGAGAPAPGAADLFAETPPAGRAPRPSKRMYRPLGAPADGDWEAHLAGVVAEIEAEAAGIASSGDYADSASIHGSVADAP